MEIDKIIAICGVSCTECDAYQATIQNDISRLKSLAAEWTRAMGRTFTVDDIICDGCRVEGKRLSAYCSSCEISLCAKSKGLPTCAHCNECPCEKIVAPPAIEALSKLRREILSAAQSK
jgi:hypothetical protein